MTQKEPTGMHVLTAIQQVMAKVGYVQKTGKMKSGPAYTYVSESDLLQALRPAMLEAGLVVVPEEVTLLSDTQYKDQNGATNNRVILAVRYAFYSAVDDSKITVSAMGEGVDKGDKATYKALTGALKYALRQATILETGDDPDATPSEEQARAKEPVAEKKQEDKKTSPAPASTATSKKGEIDFVALYGMTPPDALAMVIPDDLDVPFKGRALKDVVEDDVTGPVVLNYLAGVGPDHQDNIFQPGEKYEKLSRGARLLVDHSKVFAASLATFLKNNPEWKTKKVN